MTFLLVRIFDLGIDWNSFGNPTYDGGTLDAFNVNTTPDDLDPFGWNNQDGSTPFDFGFGNTCSRHLRPGRHR